VEEWRVVSFINPKNSIRQIAKACNMTDTEIRKVVYGLLQAGLVEMVKSPGMQQATATKTTGAGGPRQSSMQSSAVKRSVVERLITKIKEV
jgi:DNA-binding MarR family transcriptional regulator